MNQNNHSLITPDTHAGLALAERLADELHTEMEQANQKVPHPGGMNYLQTAAVPKEVVAGIMFYAISAANGGWRSAV